MANAADNKKKNMGTESRQRFAELALNLSQMADHEGLEITPFFSPELIYFSKLEDEEQKRILEQLESLVFICHKLQEQGEKIRSVKSLTWAFLKHFHCTGPSDLIDYLRDEDLVNAYGVGHKLLFGSFTFFEIFSYSLEDFYCRPWMELLKRDDPLANFELEKLSNELLAGEYNKVTSMTFIPGHICEETSSAYPVRVWLRPQICAPLYSKGKIIGYIGAFHCKTA